MNVDTTCCNRYVLCLQQHSSAEKSAAHSGTVRGNRAAGHGNWSNMLFFELDYEIRRSDSGMSLVAWMSQALRMS